MVITTIIGLILGVVLIGGTISMGAAPGGFVNIPSLLTTMGGTVAATFVSFSLKQIKSLSGVMRKAFSHVGIYLGNDQFVHSPRQGGQVRIESLTQKYWAKRYNGARRIQTN